jgi:hypothetical protein
LDRIRERSARPSTSGVELDGVGLGRDLFATAHIAFQDLAINLMFVVIYTIVSGFTIFFDESEITPNDLNRMPDSSEGQSGGAQAKVEKTLSWYERITLIIAVVSTIATLVAAVEPFVHS